MPSSSLLAPASRSAEPKSDAALVQGATDGRHGRCRAKGCPQIGSQHMQQGYTHPLQGLLRRLWPERATQHFVSARAYSAASGADTSDSLRCDARSTRARRRTPPPHHIHTGRTVRLCAVRIRASSRNGAGVVGVASKHSESSRPRLRPRIARGPSLPSSGFDVRRGAGLLQGRASNGPTKGAAIVLARRPSSGGAPWYRGEASFWDPLAEEKSNWRVHRKQLAACKTLAS